MSNSEQKSGIAACHDKEAMQCTIGSLRKVFASISGALQRVLGVNQGDFGSQRMCPFCGLITSSRKTSCLECGKQFKPA